MPFKLSVPTDEADFPELIQGMWTSFKNPRLLLFDVMMPTTGSAAEQRHQGTSMLGHGYSGTLNSPNAVWVKVVDDETGKVAGAGCARLMLDARPYDGQSTFTPTSWPEGEKREFARQMVAQLHGWRLQNMNRPHMYFDVLYVLPEYRRRGVAKMITKHMTNVADEKRLEAYLDATAYGLSIYQSNGFHIINKFDAKPEIENAGDGWREMTEAFLPVTNVHMWRPVGGNFDESKPKPWELS